MKSYIVQLGLEKVVCANGEINCIKPILGVSIIAFTCFDALLCMNTVYDNDPDCKLLEVVESVNNSADCFILN